MDALNIDQIKREATGRLEVAEKTEQLQDLVDRIYPGYKVILSKNGTQTVSAEIKDDFLLLTQTEQIERVLRERKGTMKLHKLFDALESRGSRMSFQSLMSLLSAGKKAGRFQSFGRGIWGLPEHFNAASEIFEEEKR